tara:strand:- start:682 stop:792 length:111 start_codon:yes stop_codon:yes gene_type:complete
MVDKRKQFMMSLMLEAATAVILVALASGLFAVFYPF